MPKVKQGPYEADRHSFIVPGIIDADVARKQAQERLDYSNEETVVHWHKRDEPCDGGGDIRFRHMEYRNKG